MLVEYNFFTWILCILSYNLTQAASSELIPSREEQCDQQRRTKVLGRFWKAWEPYYDHENPCQLFCKIAKINHYASYGHVMDGTTCVPGGSDICVRGTCQKAACDGVDTSKYEDDCRVCGGKNHFCKHITESFNTTGAEAKQYNYNFLTNIPKGASNIRIIDRSIINYIALQTSSTDEVLNGKWRLDSPGMYQMAGSTLIYQRLFGKQSVKEVVSILGPIDKEINVSLIQQELRRNVTVEYWMKTSEYQEASSAQSEIRPVIATYHINVRKRGNKTTGVAVKGGNEERRQLLETYHIRVRPKVDSTQEQTVQNETQSKLVAVYDIRVHRKGQSRDDKSKEDRRRDIYKYLVDNRIPSVLPNSSPSYRIPARPDNIVERMEFSNIPCSQSSLETHMYVKQEPVEDQNPYRHNRIGGLPVQPHKVLFRPVPDQGSCEECRNNKLTVNDYCTAAFVARIKALNMEVLGPEIRYEVEVAFIYRSVEHLNLIAKEYIYIPVNLLDPSCACPRLTLNREYYVLGDYMLDGDVLKLTLDKDSIIRTYTFNHMYQFTHIEKSAKC